MDELTIMEVPEPPSMGTAGGLLMEQIPKVRQSLTKGQAWEDIVLEATSPKGAFGTYDDANDPDVTSVAALFSAGEHEEWGGGPFEGPAKAVPSLAGVKAAGAAEGEKQTPRRDTEKGKGGIGEHCGNDGGGVRPRNGGGSEEAPASSVKA